MTDEELIEEFLRVDTLPDQIQILCTEISWEGHTPVSRWTPAKKLSPSANPEAVEAALRSVLTDRRFFRVCTRCKERQPRG